jgi:dynein heavy chain
MQLQIGSGDLTTTWIPFNFYLNTRANKSLAYGPGLLQDVAPGTPVEFMLQARNDDGKNRLSGRDSFEVRVRRIRPKVDAVVEEEAPEEDEEEHSGSEADVEEKVRAPKPPSPDDVIDC